MHMDFVVTAHTTKIKSYDIFKKIEEVKHTIVTAV